MSEQVIDRLREYVEMESPSGDVERAKALAAKLAADFEAVGAEVERVDAPGWGEHVRARVTGQQPELAPLLLIGHLDTVHAVGAFGDRPFTTEAGFARGPGVFDMKSGVLVILEALRSLADRGTSPRRPVEVLITCDEELGSGDSRPHLEAAGRRAHAALVLEPSLPGGAAKTARKGVANYTIVATGRAAHAGVDPERGVSAVTELAHQVLALRELADPAAGTTINPGVIRGGTATNVVAARAEVDIDVRFATASEGARVERALKALKPTLEGAAVRVEGTESRPPLERTPGVVALYEQARALAERDGWTLAEGSTGGASDGSLIAALGTPTLDGLGPDGGGAHAVDEHIKLDELPRRIRLIAGLLETL